MPELPAPVVRRLKAPSWLDGRLVAGALLIVVSVVVGAKVIASSGDYDRMWAASHDLATGTTLTKGDLVSVKVRFHDHGKGYFSTGTSLVGRVMAEPVSSGELIPVAAAPKTPQAPTRMVTVPVAKLHMPRTGDLAGTQVDMYVTPKGSDDGPAASRLVLANVSVVSTITDSSLGSVDGSAVVLSVPVPYVGLVVSAAESGSIDLVLVPGAQGAASPSPGDFAPTPSAAASPGSASTAAFGPVAGATA